MTDRERWTVYPLLFMTLGIAVKDRIVNLSNVDTVLCSTLVVRDRQGAQQVVISSTPAGGIMRTYGKSGLGVAVGHDQKLTGLMFVDPSGKYHQSLASVEITAPRDLPGPGPGEPTQTETKPAQPPDESGESPPPARAEESPRSDVERP